MQEDTITKRQYLSVDTNDIKLTTGTVLLEQS
jgi:hypothetical protein